VPRLVDDHHLRAQLSDPLVDPTLARIAGTDDDHSRSAHLDGGVRRPATRRDGFAVACGHRSVGGVEQRAHRRRRLQSLDERLAVDSQQAALRFGRDGRIARGIVEQSALTEGRAGTEAHDRHTMAMHDD
jgi:hypothetical protein